MPDACRWAARCIRKTGVVTDENHLWSSQVTDDAVAAGATEYSRPVLSVYDLYVPGFSNTFVCQCPSRLMLAFYNEHISGRHLDVGVRT